MLLNVFLTFPYASPNNRRAWPIVRYGTFHVWLQTNILLISRAIATNRDIFSWGDAGDIIDANVTGALEQRADWYYSGRMF